MKVTINNENTNNIPLVYEEGFWTGKRNIVYDGETLVKKQRNVFQDKAGNEVIVKGNQMFGLTISMFDKQAEVVRKLNWFEILFAVLIFAPCVLFGAIGGAIGGGFAGGYMLFIRKIEKLHFKIIISLLLIGITILLSYIFAYLVFKFAIFI